MALPRHRRSPPALPDHLLEDIFSRLPPDDPSCLLRASLVCKHWRDVISDPSFLRHLHAHRRAPQMLGFLQKSEGERLPGYVPTSPFSFPVPDPRAWHVLGYRHGRAVFDSETTDRELLVWEPFTGDRWKVPVPAEFKIRYSNATVLCAAEGCDHLNCHGGPFRIVLVFCDPLDEETDWLTSACVYTSKTGAWGELALCDGFSLVCGSPGLLVGNSLLYFLSVDGYILQYDLAQHVLDVIHPPDHDAAFMQRVMLVQAEDGGLGIAEADDEGWNRIFLWSWEMSEGGAGEWVERRAIYLDDLLPYAAVSTSSQTQTAVFLMGFAEGANILFVGTCAVFNAAELQSKLVRQVCKKGCNFYPLVPIVSSYTIGSTLQVRQIKHLRYPELNEEADGEEWEWVKELMQAEFLFDKGSMAIEMGDFVAAVDCLSRVLALRVARYGELAPECASTYYKCGRALLYKAQEATHPLSNVDTEEGDGGESDVDLAKKMLDTARIITEKTTDKTVETPKILSALTEVAMEKRKREIRQLNR